MMRLYIKDAYKVDLIIEDKLVTELKSISPSHLFTSIKFEHIFLF